MATPLAPQKNSKRSLRRKHRKFVSLDRSSRKHRRANNRMYLNTDPAHKKKGKINYH